MSELYGVKVIYKHTVYRKELAIFYEEQILTVMANSFDEAYDKAKIYAEVVCTEYQNPYNELVKTEIVELADCFLAFDEEDGVSEVYSRVIQNKTNLSEEDYISIIKNSCTKEDMYILRNAEFNKKQ